MHPVLFEIGSFPLGTYGLLLAIAFFAGTWLAKRQGLLDGLAPSAITDLAIAMLISAIVGSKLLMILVDLINGEPFREVFSLATLRAGGAIHGGIIAATAVFFWKLRKGQGLPLRLTGDALVPGVALGQAIGRLGCFSAGCCYGTESHAPWAVTFTNPIAQAFSGTPLGMPLHPVQLYNTLANLAVMAVLLVARPKRTFRGQIFALYFLVEGLGRVVTETWRGDVDRGTGWLSWAWLSTGRLTGIAFMLLGMGLWLVWSRSKETR
ncbi:prolipoprotein diacylglyceryl transferase [Geothrix sp. PMB-07]|uniref:prolipoprotein diacylglyceryl transferase n=1 Tax=Geothrix sp. PMB-07 TaxID=3068640 RepID=UPI0027418D5C|nr:prolipoprotein diacylglyceryl transferase [Geothrix sp. PMB-07]WLT32622.1 prolipoprotein diacylglyceryl transferase [Geothrix sp. PMB-07]